MARRRSTFGPMLLLGLCSAGLAVVGGGRTWAEATTTAQGFSCVWITQQFDA